MECAICFNLLTEEGELTTSTHNPRGQPSAPKRKMIRSHVAGSKNTGPELSSPSCGHIFHRVCILDWLERGNHTCPNCRQPATKGSLKSVFLPSNDTSSSSQGQGNFQQNSGDDQLKNQLASLMRENADLREKLALEQAEKVALRHEVKERDEKILKEQEKLEQRTESLDVLKVTNSRIQENYNMQRAENINLLKKVEDLSDELAKLREKQGQFSFSMYGSSK